MGHLRHFAHELVKLAFAPGKGMPIPMSEFSVKYPTVPKPLTLGARVPKPVVPKPPVGLKPSNKVPGLRNMGTKMDPARANPTPPPADTSAKGGGSNVK